MLNRPHTGIYLVSTRGIAALLMGTRSIPAFIQFFPQEMHLVWGKGLLCSMSNILLSWECCAGMKTCMLPHSYTPSRLGGVSGRRNTCRASLEKACGDQMTCETRRHVGSRWLVRPGGVGWLGYAPCMSRRLRTLWSGEHTGSIALLLLFSLKTRSVDVEAAAVACTSHRQETSPSRELAGIIALLLPPFLETERRGVTTIAGQVLTEWVVAPLNQLVSNAILSCLVPDLTLTWPALSALA